MLREAALKAGKYVLIFIGIVLLAITIISYAYSVTTHLDFITTLRTCIFYVGIILMAMGALLGIGSAEVAYTNNPLFKISSHFQNAGVEGRSERRRQQFVAMLFLTVIGLVFIVLASIV